MSLLKKIKDDFAAAARRFAAVTVFAGSSLFFPGTAAAQTAPANNNAAQTEQTAKKHAPLSKKQKREKINAALVQQGQTQFMNLLPAVESNYSCQLQDLQQELNARVQAGNPNTKIRVVVLDPIQMDVGLGLGLKASETVLLMLLAQGVKVDASMVRQVYVASQALTGVLYVSTAKDSTYTQFPMTLRAPQEDSLGGLRIVVPSSGYAPAFQVPGLSLQEGIQFINRHEGWHAIERKNRYAGIDYSKLNPDSLQTIRQKISNTDHLKFSCALYNGESFADVGAAGDMIRNGQPLSLIDNLIAMRMSSGNHDVSHMSPPSLRELKKRIEEMGLEKFRALGDAEAAQLYNDAVAQAGLTPARLTFVYKYVECPPEKRMDFVVEHQCDPDFAAAFSYINSFVTEDITWSPGHKNHKRSVDISLLIGVLNISAWDAEAELQKRAIAIDGRITPASYAKAYGALMNELDSQFDGAGIEAQTLLTSKMVKLKNTFLAAVTTTDYVAANKAYGVDIIAAEPALQTLFQPAPARSNFFHRR